MRSLCKDDDEFKSILKIHSFLKEEFTKQVNVGDEYEYKITIAIAEIFLSDKHTSGLHYPSIVQDVDASNFGIKPKAARNLLEPTHCWAMQIGQLEPLRYYIPPKRAKQIKKDGTIVITDKANDIMKEVFEFDHKEWNIEENVELALDLRKRFKTFRSNLL